MRVGRFPQLSERRRAGRHQSCGNRPSEQRRERRPWRPLGRESHSSGCLLARVSPAIGKRLRDFRSSGEPVVWQRRRRRLLLAIGAVRVWPGCRYSASRWKRNRVPAAATAFTGALARNLQAPGARSWRTIPGCRSPSTPGPAFACPRALLRARCRRHPRALRNDPRRACGAAATPKRVVMAGLRHPRWMKSE